MTDLEALKAAVAHYQPGMRDVVSVDPGLVRRALDAVNASRHPDASRPEGVVPYLKNRAWEPPVGQPAMIPIRHLHYLAEVYSEHSER